MDIKSKNSNSNDSSIEIKETEIKEKRKINFYSLKFKVIIVILICIFSAIVCNTYFFLENNKYTYKGYNIKYRFAEYCNMVVDAKLNLQNEEHIREVYEKKYKDTDSENNDKTIEDNVNKRTNDLNNINSNLNRVVNFVYLIKDSKTGNIIYTNIENNPNIKIINNTKTNKKEYEYKDYLEEEPVNILVKQNNYLSIINGISNYTYIDDFRYYNFIENTQSLLKDINLQNDYELHFAIIEPIRQSSLDSYQDNFYDLYQEYLSVAKVYPIMKVINIILFILLIILTVIIIILSGKNEKYGPINLLRIDKIPVEIYILITIGICLLFLDVYSDEITLTILSLILTFIIISCICSISRRLKAKIFIKTTLTYYFIIKLNIFINDIKYIFTKGIKRQVIIFLSLIIFLIIINGIWYMIIFLDITSVSGELPTFIMILLTVILNFIFIFRLIMSFVSLQKISQATKEIAQGNTKYYINSSNFPQPIKILADNITKMQDGLNEAVKKAIQDEHLKTELITNVSHDLKTPLTSIINYVDLLKQENLNSDKAYEYLDILDEKSVKLKQLIEDLIEASKASSGNISVTLEKLDLQQLIMQSYGEYEDRLSKNNLEVYINSLENQLMVCADGKHMWRIISNLLSNVSKYALPNSRVYINLIKEESYALISIKNISEYQLNMSPNHLTERFVRGDSSRTTEGSGLGLSIAQSLTEVQKGKFEIIIDGDLFKVNIKIPLWI